MGDLGSLDHLGRRGTSELASRVGYVKIKKTKPGEAIEAGKKLAAIIPIFKIVVVVDDDIDVLDPTQVNMALGSRWQPFSGTYIFEDARGMTLDPSLVERGRSSKIVIDATRQWPEEGGPKSYPEYSRDVLANHDPGIFERIDAKWADVIARSLV